MTAEPWDICRDWSTAEGLPDWTSHLLDFASDDDPDGAVFQRRGGIGRWEYRDDIPHVWAEKYAWACANENLDVDPFAVYDLLAPRAETVLNAVVTIVNLPLPKKGK